MTKPANFPGRVYDRRERALVRLQEALRTNAESKLTREQLKKLADKLSVRLGETIDARSRRTKKTAGRSGRTRRV